MYAADEKTRTKILCDVSLHIQALEPSAFNGLDDPSERWFLGEPSGLNTAPLRLLESRELDDCGAKVGTVRVE